MVPPSRAAAGATAAAAPASLGAGDAASDGGASGSEGERAIREDRGTPAGAWLPSAESGWMPGGAAAASALTGGPAGGTGGSHAGEDDSADRGRRRRERMEEQRRRFGAETAARIGNGYVSAKMLRARMLHYAILRLLGAPLHLALQATGLGCSGCRWLVRCGQARRRAPAGVASSMEDGFGGHTDLWIRAPRFFVLFGAGSAC